MEGFKRGTRMLLKATLTVLAAVTVIMTVKVSAYAMEYGTWVWPVPTCRTTSQPYDASKHPGIDIGASLGSDVVTAKSGTVATVINNCSHIKVAQGVCSHRGYGDGGNQVMITHDDGTHSIYSHMIMGSITVSEGQRVTAGQVIGKVGQSGCATGPHLHFAVRYGGNRFWDSAGMFLNPTALVYSDTPTPEDGTHVLNYNAVNITYTSAHIYANYDAVYYATENGFFIGTSLDNMTRVKDTKAVNMSGNSFNLGGEDYPSLTPNTTYYYQLYFITGGVMYKTVIDKFKTKSYDVSSPTISDVKVTNVTTEGYRVSCTVTDNVGVTKVQFPTWTENNGQDDLAWHNAVKSGDTYYYDVKISEHKNERGKYCTDIYAWDAAGNQISTGVRQTIPEPTPLYYLDLNGFLDKIDYALLNADETGNDLGTFGTADIYINGVKVADDVNDYWEAYPVGTKYEIKDIKAKGNTHYSKVLKGSLSGTIQAKRCNVWLYFETNKKQKVQNKITAKDITITAKTKAQTVNLNASALGGAKLSYSGKKAKVNSKGVVTVPAKYVGCLIIKVTAAATNDYLQTTKDVRIYVQPIAPTLKKATSNYKKTIYVNWSTVKICDGYEVWYSTRQDMKNAKCVAVKGNNKKSVEFKKTSGKTYYIRVRAYKKVNGNKNYSAYSNRKKVKVK